MLRKSALVVFFVASLGACSNATETAPVIDDSPALRSVGEAWGSAPAETASGAWEAELVYHTPAASIPAYTLVNTAGDGPYLLEDSPAAAGLLTLVNTASADVLDQQVQGAEGPVVGTILANRPFQTVAQLDELPGMDRPALDGLLQLALTDGYVAEFDHRELLIEIANRAADANWDLDQSYGDHVREVSDGDAERTLGSLPGELIAAFVTANALDGVQVSTSTHAILAYGVPVGWIVGVVTDDPTMDRFGTQYFVSAAAERDIVVQADFVAE